MPDKNEIIERMLEAIPDNYDKGEGSFIYDAILGVADALDTAYIDMEINLDNGFADTAVDDYLERITSEVGVFRKEAVAASTILTITGTDNTEIPTGTKFYSEELAFLSQVDVTILNGLASVEVVCETTGIIGNVPADSINESELTSGINSVTNSQAVINGFDEETDEALRQRYYEKVLTPTTSGNAQHYKNWCLEVNGVGNAKIFPLWNGNGTVKCSVINSNMRAADTDLVNTVIQHVEENRPIGANVTVESATELPVNISVEIDLVPGFQMDYVKSAITKAVSDYLKDIAFQKDYVSYAQIGSVIIDIEGISDYQNLTLNNSTNNVAIGSTQVAVVGVINVT